MMCSIQKSSKTCQPMSFQLARGNLRMVTESHSEQSRFSGSRRKQSPGQAVLF